MSLVLDYSAGCPGAVAIKAFGAIGTVRYAGTPGRRKNLTAVEFADLDRAGLGVATVHENQPGDYLGGRSAGAAAGAAWLADVTRIDHRLTRVGHFAVDTDVTTQWSALAEYFRGVNSVIGIARTRAYGEADVIDYLVGQGLVSGGQWQTVAWSHGVRSTHAALFQRAQQPVVGGIACDINDVLATDWGQHNYEEDDMQLTDPWDEDKISARPGTVGHAFLNIKQNAAASRALDTANQATIRVLASALADQSGGAYTLDQLGERVNAEVTKALQDNTVSVHVDVAGNQTGAGA